MKLNFVSRKLGRQERLRRDRAAAQVMGTAFPAIDRLRLDLTFGVAEPVTPAAQVHILHPGARAFFLFPCPFSGCDGEFDLAAIVADALARPEHRAEGVLECTGQRFREAGRHQCGLLLTYRISAS